MGAKCPGFLYAQGWPKTPCTFNCSQWSTKWTVLPQSDQRTLRHEGLLVENLRAPLGWGFQCLQHVLKGPKRLPLTWFQVVLRVFCACQGVRRGHESPYLCWVLSWTSNVSKRSLRLYWLSDLQGVTKIMKAFLESPRESMYFQLLAMAPKMKCYTT